MIDEERIWPLNIKPVERGGAYVLYWMQASQRAEYNHALEYAVGWANELKLPLLVFFGLTDRFPEANERHYRFMLEGLKETKEALHSRGIGMIIRKISPEKGVVELARDAAVVVCDRGYLRIQRQWRQHAADSIACPLIQVESDAVIPIETASGKEEYSAATLRKKIVPLLSRFIRPLETETLSIDSTGMQMDGIDIPDLDSLIASLDIDRSVKPVEDFRGGTKNAKLILKDFVEDKLERYGELRNDPSQEYQSDLSPYLHFGQISPVYIAQELMGCYGAGVEAFLEELIVRRELSLNFVYYNENYDSFSCLPDWARKTLEEHAQDTREYVYSVKELEQGRTHDRYWNAAQKQMAETGKMHGYMRMYWGKKILEWSETPETAFTAALYLNNKYSLDGRDPNSFTGVAWCFGKHDRPWAGRPVFGNIRYMNANGLKRKFDIETYAEKWA